MKASTIFSVVAGASLAAAQLDQIPTCALTCAISSIGASGCAQTDIACICSASTFLTGILSCIQGSCSEAEIQKTLSAAQVLCASAGVTITVPGGTTSTSPATTEAPVETTTTTTEAPVETTSEAPVETMTTTSTMAPPVYGTSSVVTMTTTTTICPSSTYVAPVYTPPASNATVSVPPPAYTGAAGSVAANAGAVLVGAALAMFFA